MKNLMAEKYKLLLFIFFPFFTACSMQVDISSTKPKDDSIVKARGAEVTSGSNRQKTNRGYIVESQIGNPIGAVSSKTDKNFTVYHSVKMGTSAE